MANKKKKNANIKEIKRKNSSKIDQVSVGGFDGDIWGKIIIVLVVVVVLGLFYLLTLYITNKNSTDDSKTTSTSEETVISSDKIVLGRSFSMDDEHYAVLYYDKSDEDISSVYDSLVMNYKSKEDALRVYTVDMSSALNKSHATTGEGNHNPTNASELSIKGPTLIVFSNHTVEDYLEGEEAITNYLS